MLAGATGAEPAGVAISAAAVAPSAMSLVSVVCIVHSSVSSWKDQLPVLLHVDDGPAALHGLVQGVVELADVRLPVVGVFALGIGVMNEAGKARAHSPVEDGA